MILNNLTFGFIILSTSLGITVITIKKDKIIIPIILAMCFLPADLSIKIFTLDFQAVRIMAIFALIRIYFDFNEQKLQFNSIDILFLTYNILGAIIYFIASNNKFGAFLYKSGALIDSAVLYLAFRYIIQSKKTIDLIVKTFCICVIILLPFIVFEFFTANNLFSFLGRSAIAFRDGEVRAAGTFSHSILFGSFAAAIFPIIWAALMRKRNPVNSFSIFCCLFFIYACSSSGPLVALAAVIFFLFFFKWKHYSSYLAWSILFASIFVHFIREKPLWHLIYVRLTVRAGSTGYHRYLLMEAAVKEFWNWCLLGYGDIGAQWHLKYWPWTHARFTDITNQYLLEAVRGGFLTMLLFIILCYKVIKTLGKFSISQNNIQDQWLWWGFTVMMITHCVTFLSVSYFGQIQMLFILTVAVAAYAADETIKKAKQLTENQRTKNRFINRRRQSHE